MGTYNFTKRQNVRVYGLMDVSTVHGGTVTWVGPKNVTVWVSDHGDLKFDRFTGVSATKGVTARIEPVSG